jgi:rare lipoprotein A
MKKALVGAALAVALIGTSSAAFAESANQSTGAVKVQQVELKASAASKSESGKISWYNGTGKKGAFGKIIPADGAAHKTLAFQTRVLVKSDENKKTTYVRIYDRGPYVSGRILDMTKEAFEKLHPTSKGVFKGTITY